MKATKIFIIRDVNEDEIIGATNSEENAVKMMKEYLCNNILDVSPEWADKINLVATKIDYDDMFSSCRYNPYEKLTAIQYVITEQDPDADPEEEPDEEYEFELIPVVYEEVKKNESL